jgi:UTP--glucose-1-phosphate uridylyltransferase
VFQLETALGTAISLFERSAAVRVPRRRFSPVKNTDDLLNVRSNAYRLTDDARVVLDESRSDPPVVSLDGRFYKLIDEFDRRFPAGPPSLLRCDSLTIEGDVTFAGGVEICGDARISATEPGTIESGTVVTGNLDL